MWRAASEQAVPGRTWDSSRKCPAIDGGNARGAVQGALKLLGAVNDNEAHDGHNR